MHRDHVIDDPQHPQPFAAAQGVLRDGDLVAALERLAQQGVRLGGRDPVGGEVVRRVHLEQVDLVGGHEGDDLDGLGRGQRELGEILVGDRDHRAVGVLVGLADLAARHLLLVQLTDLAVPDPATVGEVDLPEVDRVVLGGVDELDRDAHQPEGDRAVPYGPHRSPLLAVKDG